MKLVQGTRNSNPHTVTDAAAEITLNPPFVKLLGNSNHKPLTISCAPPSDAGIERLISLTIRRNATNMPQDLASAFSGTENGTARNLSKLNGTTVSGSIDDQNITFTMPVLSCADDGLYICDAVYLKSINSAPVTSTDQKHLAVRALPGAITMTSVDQNGDQVLTAGTKLELMCEGFVGDEEDRSEVTWKWQYEVHDGVAFHDYESTDDINNGPITQDPDVPCQRRQTSRLTRTLTPDDSGRRYRCLVRLGSIDFTGQAAYHTLGEVSGKVGEVSSEGDDSPSGGAIAGIVIGVVLACAWAVGINTVLLPVRPFHVNLF
ncbi:hypothetical protein BaRGS_00038048 [Batillaria attramentaria]|uniref:Ig-like domain-containing protein n=1 Tax=Batillaria attramentaria TaxID=370345 RepID=A0ABD0J6Z4_9CAEN